MCVISYDLKENYKLIKVFPHKCEKCGKRMHKAKKEEMEQLILPMASLCGINNKV